MRTIIIAAVLLAGCTTGAPQAAERVTERVTDTAYAAELDQRAFDLDQRERQLDARERQLDRRERQLAEDAAAMLALPDPADPAAECHDPTFTFDEYMACLDRKLDELQ